MDVMTMLRRMEPGVILAVQHRPHPAAPTLLLLLHQQWPRNRVPLHRMQPSHNRGAWYPPVAHERRLLTHLDRFEMKVYGQVPAGTGVNNSGMEGNRCDSIHLAHNRRTHRLTPTTADETDGCGCHGDAHLTDLTIGGLRGLWSVCQIAYHRGLSNAFSVSSTKLLITFELNWRVILHNPGGQHAADLGSSPTIPRTHLVARLHGLTLG